MSYARESGKVGVPRAGMCTDSVPAPDQAGGRQRALPSTGQPAPDVATAHAQHGKLRFCCTGCGAAWLARLLWEQEAAGSNPAIPTRSEYILILKRLSLLMRCLACSIEVRWPR